MPRIVTDQLQQQLAIPDFPKRIISLVPSQTELLHALGLEDRVVGITKFCVHPRGWRKSKRIIGGTKQFDMEAIDALNPDLIIGNKEENYEAGILTLRERYPVWMSDINSLQDAYTMMSGIGELTNTKAEAEQMIADIQQGLSMVQPLHHQKVLYLIWRDPWMAAGTRTFVNSMLTEIGLQNALSIERYPELTAEQIKSSNADFVFLSSEPFPFREKHIYELQQLLPATKVILVDGEMFSWYGSRLLFLPDYISSLHSQLKT